MSLKLHWPSSLMPVREGHVPVHIMNLDDMRAQLTEEQEPQHVSAFTRIIQAGTTWQGPGNNPFEEILAQDPLRKTAYIATLDAPVILVPSRAAAQDVANTTENQLNINGALLTPDMGYQEFETTAPLWAVATPGSVTGGSAVGFGVATSPAAGQAIETTGAKDSALYDIKVIIGLSGTPAQADANNMAFFINGGQIGVLSFPGIVGSYSFDFQQFVSQQGSTFQVKAIGAATAGAVYSSNIISTVLSGGNISNPCRVSVLSTRRGA